MQMTTFEQDPDVVRWGLHHLIGVCSLSTGGSPATYTSYDKDFSTVGYVQEGYCEANSCSTHNDEMIAYAFEEELSRLANSHADEEHQRASVLAQDWLVTSNQYGPDTIQQEETEGNNYSLCSSSEKNSVDGNDLSFTPEMAYESILDGEVGKRLNQMVPVPHVPKVNGMLPSADEEISDHQRLMDRLHTYDLVELKVSGDGNCQFRSLSDQIYRSSKHHKFVRELIVDQLKSHPELYEGYVPMAYDVYLKKISKTGEWGDHVSLQAAADSFGVKIFIITSFKDTCYIEILPCVQKSQRIIFLSFWAEVHYNSIYPPGELPAVETEKQKWWQKIAS